jgi:predicted nucleic acid-binding protein
MSSAGYPNPLRVQAVVERLAAACNHNIHEFWQDDITLLDSNLVDSTRIHGPRQLTDIFLLALAVKHAGKLVTFDNGIPLGAVKRATKQNLLVL